MTPRDDLFSLWYAMYELAVGDLPWREFDQVLTTNFTNIIGIVPTLYNVMLCRTRMLLTGVIR